MFDVLDLCRSELRLLEESNLHGNLRLDVGRNQALRAAVVLDIGRLNNTNNSVTIPQCGGLRLHDETGSGFRGDVAVGLSQKRKLMSENQKMHTHQPCS